MMTVALFASLFVLTGCSQTAAPVGNQTRGASNPNSQEDGSNSNRDNARAGRRMPDFGQPQRQPDIRGLVKSIVGNEATVLKIDMGQRQASSTPEMGTSTKEGAALSFGNPNSPGGRMPAGGPGGPGGFGGPGEQTENSRVKMLEELKKISTGEEKIILPVGIQMLKSSRNDETKKMEMVEASLSDITADKTVTIWLNAQITDKKVAEFVLIN